jgi:hypothetical protein
MELDAMEMEKEEEVESLRLRNIFLKAQVWKRVWIRECSVL